MPTSISASATDRTVSSGRSRKGRPAALAVTSGDPCGVGPELVLRALAERRRASAALIVIGSLEVFRRQARLCRLPIPNWTVVSKEKPFEGAARLRFLEMPVKASLSLGASGKAAGRASLDYLDAAMDLWRGGWIQGLVTAPVTKWAIQKSDPSFIGQTEYLGAATGAKQTVMMFAAEDLRVVLLTRHLPLRAVSRALTMGKIESTVRLAHDALRRLFGMKRPRLALCGLNPHAGEQGSFGDEEQTRLAPAAARLRRSGIVLDGPLAADAVFAQSSRWDAVVCCYHDQALIPFKMMARDRGAQLTAGLPLVRTSPDHGSALDIAGRGLADPGAMNYALDLAVRLLQKTPS